MTVFNFLNCLSTIPNKDSLLYYKDVVITGIYVSKWKIILSTAKHTKKCTTIRHIADTLIRFNNRQQISIVLNYKFRYYNLNTITFKNNYVELFLYKCCLNLLNDITYSICMTIEQLLNELRSFNKDSLIGQINNVQQYDDKIVVLNRINKTAINVRKLVQLLLNYPENYKVLIKLDIYLNLFLEYFL